MEIGDRSLWMGDSILVMLNIMVWCKLLCWRKPCKLQEVPLVCKVFSRNKLRYSKYSQKVLKPREYNKTLVF